MSGNGVEFLFRNGFRVNAEPSQSRGIAKRVVNKACTVSHAVPLKCCCPERKAGTAVYTRRPKVQDASIDRLWEAAFEARLRRKWIRPTA